MRKNLYKILQQVDTRIKIKNYEKDYQVGDLKYWDSLSHLNFLMAIEANYKIRFNANQMTTIKSISDIEKILKKIKK